MKYEFEFSESEIETLNNTNVTDESKLKIFQRKFNAITKGKTLASLIDDLHLRCNNFFLYVSETCDDNKVRELMKAYIKDYIKVEDDLKYYLEEIVNKGYDDVSSNNVKIDILVIHNRIRRAYDHAEPYFCEKGIAFVDINEKRIGICNCLDKIVGEVILTFETDEGLLKDL